MYFYTKTMKYEEFKIIVHDLYYESGVVSYGIHFTNFGVKMLPSTGMFSRVQPLTAFDRSCFYIWGANRLLEYVKNRLKGKASDTISNYVKYVTDFQQQMRHFAYISTFSEEMFLVVAEEADDLIDVLLDLKYKY